MSAIASGLQWFVNLGASVMLPILLFIFALILRIKPSKAFKAGLMVGIGFIGLNLVISLLTKNLGPASHAMVRNFGMHLGTIDIGWPAASAIAYGTVLGSLAIPVGVVTNVVLLLLGLTQTLDVDVWNYWHIAFTGSLVYAVSHSFSLGIFTMIVHSPPYLIGIIKIIIPIMDGTAKLAMDLFELFFIKYTSFLLEPLLLFLFCLLLIFIIIFRIFRCRTFLSNFLVF